MRRLLVSLVVASLAVAIPATTSDGASAPAAPSCGEGPAAIGDMVLGTPCADLIVAPPGAATVRGGGGDDTIVPAALAAGEECPEGCRLGVGSQTFEGGPGNDTVYGERGNDTLRGGEGDDRLYGGIGDDLLRGGGGQDQLSGGFGADSIDGDAGDDYVRGDGTIDRIFDTGGGTDTLSYSTGVTPGFGGASTPVPGFPSADGERGVSLDLGAGGLNGNNGMAAFGGGVDEVEGQSFEKVVGTAFSDYIVGTEDGETIYGGGGADAILGEGGNDLLVGGADGDHLDGGGGSADSLDGGPGEDHCEDGESTAGCEPAKAAGVVPRDTTKISVGFSSSGAPARSQLYLVGSGAAESVTVTYAAGPPATVTFQLGAGSTGSFDTSPAAAGGCGAPAGGQVVCTTALPLDSILLAGMGGNDTLHTAGFPATVSVILTGGEGSDDLAGGALTEDVLVDGDKVGAGDDTLSALGGDDALLHNAGADVRLGGEGNDLFLSVSICDGDELRGEGGRDNASWARLEEAVHANLELGSAGRPGPGPAPACGGGQLDSLQTIEDLEATSSDPGDPGDVLYGDQGPNQLLGWSGTDSFFAGEGDDSILANSGDTDKAIDCGGGSSDKVLIDRPNPAASPPYADPAPVGCELVEEADVNSFRFQTQLPPPPPPEEESPPPAAPRPPPARVDSRAPRTRITGHPRSLLVTSAGRRRVVFRFAASEKATFRCRLDRRAAVRCVSPRAFWVKPGRHVLRVIAVDSAGNVDRSPSIFRFRVRRR